MAIQPNPRLARLLQPGLPPDRSCSPNPTLDLTIELARVRAAACAMANALGVVAIYSADESLRRMAEEALDLAVQMLD